MRCLRVVTWLSRDTSLLPRHFETTRNQPVKSTHAVIFLLHLIELPNTIFAIRGQRVLVDGSIVQEPTLYQRGSQMAKEIRLQKRLVQP